MLRIDVDGHGDVLAVDKRTHLVLVRNPRRKGLHIPPHSLVLGVEQMGPVPIHPDPGFLVRVIVAIASDVVPLLHHQHGLVQLQRILLGNDAARQPRPYYADVVGFRDFAAARAVARKYARLCVLGVAHDAQQK